MGGSSAASSATSGRGEGKKSPERQAKEMDRAEGGWMSWRKRIGGGEEERKPAESSRGGVESMRLR